MEILAGHQSQDGHEGADAADGAFAVAANSSPEPAPIVYLPVEIPPLLGMPESKRRRRAALGGVFFGVFASLAIFLFSPEGSSPHQMFDLRTLGGLIPLMILVMFFWGGLLCLLRWRRLRLLEGVCRRSLVLTATTVVQTRGVSGLLDDLTAPVVSASPLLRRLRAAGEQWRMSPDLASVDTVLALHAAHDEEDVHAGYSLLRTFVWALPVLGLIGTVIGISVAVGGFAEFLGGDIEDVSVIKTNLVSVTAGLSYAFLITLIGLGTSLVLMLATSALQTREEGVYSSLQQSIADVFLPALQRETAASLPGPTADLDAWKDALNEIARAVLVEAGRFGEAILDGLAARDRTHSDQAARMVSDLRHQATAAVETMIAGAHDAGERLRAAAAGVVTSFTELDTSLMRSRQQLVEKTAAQADALTVLQGGVTAASERWQAASNAIAETASRLEAHVQQLIEPQLSLGRVLSTFDIAALRAALEQHDSVSARHADVLDRASQRMGAVVDLTRQAISTQADLAQAVTGLQQTGVLPALSQLPESIRDLTPVLRSFREPFVLQAVPVAVRPGAQDGGPAVALT